MSTSDPTIPDKQVVAFNPQKRVEYSIAVVGAKNLPGVEHQGSSSDPYVVIKCGNNTSQTQVIKKNLNPTWDQMFTFQSDTGQHPITFTVRNKGLLKDTILGEGTFNIERMGNEQIWEGEVMLEGHHIKSSSSCLHIKVGRKNYKTLWGKVQKSLNRVQERAKELMSDKTSNLARLAFIISHDHIVSRHLTGTLDVQVTLGFFIVSLSAEVEESELESHGTIEVVDDTNTNLGPTQVSIIFSFFILYFDYGNTKPTKNMEKTIDSRVNYLLDTIETTSLGVIRDISVTVKSGISVGFIICSAPKMEMTVQILVGVTKKVRVGSKTTIAAPALPPKPASPPADPEEDKELTDTIYKLSTGKLD